MAYIYQTGDRDLSEAEPRMHGPGPLGIGVAKDAAVGLEQRVARSGSRVASSIAVGPIVDEERLLAVGIRATQGVDVHFIGGSIQDGDAPAAADVVEIAEGSDRLPNFSHRDREATHSAIIDKLRTGQTEDAVAVGRELKAEIPGEIAFGDRTHIERPLGSLVADLGAIGRHIDMTGAGGNREGQNDVFGVSLVPGEAHIRDVVEEPEVGAQLQLARALRLELGGPGRVAEETTESILRRGQVSPPAILKAAPAQEGEHGEVRVRLGADLTVGRTELAEREISPQVAELLGELPGAARAGIPAPEVVLAEGGGSVVAQTGFKEKLVRDIEGSLAEIANEIDLRFVIDRGELTRGVGQGEGLRREEAVAHTTELTLTSAVQVLSQGKAAAQALAQLVGRRSGQIVVDLLVDQVDLDHLPQRVGNVGRCLRLPLQTIIPGVIHPERVVEAQPGQRHIVEIDVAEESIGDRAADGNVRGEERIVVAPTDAEGGSRGIGEPIGAVHAGHRIEILPVVELGWAPPCAEHDAAEIATLLHEAAVGIGVRHVPTDSEIVADPVRSLQPE